MPVELSSAYAVSRNAVFEAYDEEVIIINMVSGRYYTLDAAALALWSLLESGQSLGRIIEITQARYSGDPAAIAAAVTTFVEDLAAEELLVPIEAKANTPTPEDGTNGERPTFQKPGLSKFTDMQDLLLLDPIHEVDVQGWPHVKAAPGAE